MARIAVVRTSAASTLKYLAEVLFAAGLLTSGASLPGCTLAGGSGFQADEIPAEPLPATPEIIQSKVLDSSAVGSDSPFVEAAAQTTPSEAEIPEEGISSGGIALAEPEREESDFPGLTEDDYPGEEISEGDEIDAAAAHAVTVTLAGSKAAGAKAAGSEATETIASAVENSPQTAPEPDAAMQEELKEPSAVQPAGEEGTESAATGPIAPISVKVTQAFFQEQTLKIKIRMTALTDLDSAKVVVSVAGLKEGIEVEQHAQVVKDLIGVAELAEDQSLVATFELKTPGLTEYQVRGSWGAEGEKVISSLNNSVRAAPASEALSAASGSSLPGTQYQPDLAQPDRVQLDQGLDSTASPAAPELADAGRNQGPAVSGSTPAAPIGVESKERDETAERARLSSVPEPAPGKELALEKLSIESKTVPCEQEPCQVKYFVNASVANKSAKALTGISLAIGIYWVNDGELPRLPQPLAPAGGNEAVVGLNRLVLAPGASRKVRIAVDRDIPEVPGGQFIPHVRILEFSPVP